MDTLEIKGITDFSSARKNPYAEKIKKNGFSITVHYGPDDVAKIVKRTCEQDVDLLELDPDELQALMKFKEANLK
ncbi:MAG: hypothetical protein LBS21_16230 [Clostridiales bacterium]|jgi:hypothetical protein|nr:hypothetical protein [Clostridiales bacterium]